MSERAQRKSKAAQIVVDRKSLQRNDAGSTLQQVKQNLANAKAASTPTKQPPQVKVKSKKKLLQENEVVIDIGKEEKASYKKIGQQLHAVVNVIPATKTGEVNQQEAATTQDSKREKSVARSQLLEKQNEDDLSTKVISGKDKDANNELWRENTKQSKRNQYKNMLKELKEVNKV